MATAKILLYYVFTPLADPQAIRLWQRDLCESLGLRGRIVISPQGLNGTVGGDLKAVKRYIRKTRDYPAFTNIEFKWSEGTGFDENGDILDFPKLSVKVRNEIVSFGAPEELRVDESGVIDGGIRLAPTEVNTLVAERAASGDEVVFFDGRNAFEAQIGRFKNAVVPDVATTRDFVTALDSGRYDHLKNKAIVTYCTGGIRCEVLSGLMRSRGFGEVYQLDGGIVRYGEVYGDDGLWDGSLYVFDKRGSLDFSDRPAVIGQCSQCGSSTKIMQNCADASCREQLVVCAACAQPGPRCASHADQLSLPAQRPAAQKQRSVAESPSLS